MSVDLVSAANEGKHLFLPGYAKDYPNEWAEFINFLSDSYSAREPEILEIHKEDFMKGGRVRRGLVQIWGYMTFFPENPTGRWFKNYDAMKAQIEADYGGKTSRSSFCVINLSPSENITNRHNDLTHNLYVQCIGSVTWKIYESLTSPEFESYDLEPGDAIWVPFGVSHEVVAKTPRTAITIAFNPEGSND